MKNRHIGLAALVAGGIGATASALGGCQAVVGSWSVGDAGTTTDAFVGNPDNFVPVDGNTGTDAPVSCSNGLDTSSTAFQTAALACIESVGCSPYVPPTTIGTCIAESYLSQHMPSALATVTSCTEVFNATGVIQPTTTECPGTADAGTGSCSGNLAISCPLNVIGSVIDCGKYGAAGGGCTTFSDGMGGTTAGCVVEPSACTETNGGCVGNVDVYGCLGTEGIGQNCTSTGQACGTLTLDDDAGTSTGCFDNGGVCTTPGTSCMNETTLVECANGQAFTYDCSALGLSCQETTSGAGTCVAPGCTPNGAVGCKETCNVDGVHANFCVGGETYTVDCSKVPGFSTCGAHSAASGGFAWVQCQ